LMKWYYKACKKCKTGYNNSTNSPRCDCQNSEPMPM
jgi:RNA polymerase subunit RPABC4/transcription elongation factor Spt4